MKTIFQSGKHGQSAVEFVLLLSFMIMIFLIFFVVIDKKISNVAKDNDKMYLMEINEIVLSEIKLAERLTADFHHKFELPKNIYGKDYTLTISTDGHELKTTYNGMEYVNFFGMEVLGPIKKGDQNIIHKLDGKVKIGNNIVLNESFSGIFLNVNPEMCYKFNKTPGLGCDNLALAAANTDYPGYCSKYFGIC